MMSLVPIKASLINYQSREGTGWRGEGDWVEGWRGGHLLM